MNNELINCKIKNRGAKPFTRWWWFADKIDTEDIVYQLDWAIEMGFGGVEIAWIYSSKSGTNPEPFLSKGWKRLVLFTYEECVKRDIACDFTFGTLWPFGGSFVIPEFASKTWKGLSSQQVTRSWESAYSDAPRMVIDHLDKKALRFYAEHILDGFDTIIAGQNEGCTHKAPAFFCDSLEVDSDGLWTDSFDTYFQAEYGYSILPYMERIDEYPHRRFEYRQVISKLFLDEFFTPYKEICQNNRMLSRVQAHGAPTDILKAFALSDIPESEALLFDPEFSLIPASSSLLASRPVVSCESFTCLYGWVPYPKRSPHMKEEKISDLKLLADALFACGVNHIIWHGMPFNGKDEQKEFYASVYVGKGGSIANDLREFNGYMEQISSIMQQGVPLANLAVYLPLEDMMMLNKIPEEKMKPSSCYYWELQDLRIPEVTEGYHPTWVSEEFFKGAVCKEGKLCIGDAVFEALYVEASWITRSALSQIVRIAEEGVPVLLAKSPQEPGTITDTQVYLDLLKRLKALSHQAEELRGVCVPFIHDTEHTQLPLYRARETEQEIFCFIAHPEARGLTYPMEYGKGESTRAHTRSFEFYLSGSQEPIRYQARFDSCQSLLLRIDKTTGRIAELKLPSYRAIREAVSSL